jgi:hypothetical protein
VPLSAAGLTSVAEVMAEVMTVVVIVVVIVFVAYIAVALLLVHFAVAVAIAVDPHVVVLHADVLVPVVPVVPVAVVAVVVAVVRAHCFAADVRGIGVVAHEGARGNFETVTPCGVVYIAASVDVAAESFVGAAYEGHAVENEDVPAVDREG